MQFQGTKGMGMPISEKICHSIECYQKNRNKTQVECISNQKMAVDIPVKAKIKDGNSEKHECFIGQCNPSQKKPADRFKYVCVFCPKLTFLSQHNIFSHITLKCEGPKHGSENQDCRKIYNCTLCGVLKNVTLHRLMQHMVEFHQEELELKQQCSKCFEFDGKTSVYEKIKHIVFAHLCQCSVCRICKGNRTASMKGGLCLNSQIRDTTN